MVKCLFKKQQGLTMRICLVWSILLALVVLTSYAAAQEYPNVVGQEENVGVSNLEANGVTVMEVKHVCHATASAGIIVSQALVSAEPLSAMIVVSDGPCQVTVPNLTGMTEATANSTLEAVALYVGTVTQICSNSVSTGLILGQNPAAGTRVDPCSAIALTVSSGPCSEGEGEPVMQLVPDVVGLAEANARAAITGAGLLPGVVYEYSTVVAAGLVIRQNPTGGTQAYENSVVTIYVSSGQPPAEGEGETPDIRTVPDVVGLAEANARAAIAGAGLLSNVVYEYSTVVAAGLVIRQNPTGGTQVYENSMVTIYVSSGQPPAEGEVVIPEMRSVPDVVGLAEANAVAAVSAAQLQPIVSYEYSTVVAEGIVMRQNPVGGTQVVINSNVNLVVARRPSAPPPAEGESSDPRVPVPNVLGARGEDARAELENAGFPVNIVEQRVPGCTKVPAGQVIDQSPNADASVPPGTTITVYVARERASRGCEGWDLPDGGGCDGLEISDGGGCTGLGSMGDILLGLFSILGLYLFSCIWGCPEPPGLS